MKRCGYMLMPAAVAALCALLFVGTLSGCTPVLEMTTAAVHSRAIGARGPAGGYIFYADTEDQFEWTYLEAAPAEEEFESVEWGQLDDDIPKYGLPSGIGAGGDNSAYLYDIQSGEYAAKKCEELSVVRDGKTYDDWFLPSHDELKAMYEVLHERDEPLGGFTDGDYWSSSHQSKAIYEDPHPLEFNFADGESMGSYCGYSNSVRAARAF